MPAGFDFYTFATQFGLPFAMAVTALITVLRGDWFTKKTHEREIDLISTHCNHTIEKLEKEVKEWRAIALGQANSSEEAVKLIKQLIESQSK
jgi:hypothetical protein